MKLALQMYSVKDKTEIDYLRTVEQVAEMGYQGIETAGIPPIEAAELKACTDRLCISVPSMHIGLELMTEHLDEVTAYAKAIGCTHLVCPWAAFSCEEDFVKVGQELEKVAKLCEKDGITIGYHNHDQEFFVYNGRLGMDILLENAPSITPEIDVFWVKRGFCDELSYVEKYKERSPYIHMKDMSNTSDISVDVGTGRVKIREIMQLLKETGKTEWAIVEQEEYDKDSLLCVRNCYENLKKML